MIILLIIFWAVCCFINYGILTYQLIEENKEQKEKAEPTLLEPIPTWLLIAMGLSVLLGLTLHLTIIFSGPLGLFSILASYFFTWPTSRRDPMGFELNLFKLLKDD